MNRVLNRIAKLKSPSKVFYDNVQKAPKIDKLKSNESLSTDALAKLFKNNIKTNQSPLSFTMPHKMNRFYFSSEKNPQDPKEDKN